SRCCSEAASPARSNAARSTWRGSDFGWQASAPPDEEEDVANARPLNDGDDVPRQAAPTVNRWSLLLLLERWKGFAPGSDAESRFGTFWRLLARALLALVLAALCAAALIAVSGRSPLDAFIAIISGALGSPHQVAVSLNRATPYLLSGAGIALCFRA